LGVQIPSPELAVERFDERVIRRHTWPAEIRVNTSVTDPQFHVSPDEFGAVVFAMDSDAVAQASRQQRF